MAIMSDITAKLDTTKIRVTQGDIPAGDWIFNGQGMVFLPKPAVEPTKEEKEKANPEDSAKEKIIIQLADKVNVTPVKAEEFNTLVQFGADKLPLATAIAGAMLLPGMGMMGGFAAGTLLGRNLATFSCELDDGRRFMGIADIKVFKRLRAIAKNKDAI